MRLADHAGNVNSQSGEDGVLAKLFEVVGIDQGYFVEFGAWDGRHLSNTHCLAMRGWRGCLIEGDSKRYRDLLASTPQPHITKVCRFVTCAGPDALDSILDDVGAPELLDILSIDVDSDDLAIWRSVTRHRARCVVIEYNPTIPFDCYFENPPGKNWGNAALSIVEHAAASGYVLVCVTRSNLIFYDRSSPGAGRFDEVTLAEAHRGPRYFWGYDGTLLRLGFKDGRAEDSAPELFRVPWTSYMTMQPIPRPLRGYMDSRFAISVARRALGLVLALLLRPGAALHAVKERTGRR